MFWRDIDWSVDIAVGPTDGAVHDSSVVVQRALRAGAQHRLLVALVEAVRPMGGVMAGHDICEEGLLVTNIDGAWEVWCGADGDNIINAHLVGTGPTRDGAVADAVRHLESIVARLQEPSQASRQVRA